MIILQPFILAGEFTIHALAVVLIGVLLVEYILLQREPGNRQKKKPILLLLGIITLSTLMTLFDFFIGQGAIWPNIFIYVPGIAVILYLAFLFKNGNSHKGASIYFYPFISAVGVTFLCTILFIFTQHPFVAWGSTLSQVIGVVAFFLYIHSFLITDGDTSGSMTIS